MYIYNKEKIELLRKKLKLEELSYDEMCKFLFTMLAREGNKEYKNKNFTEIGTGSSRQAFLVKDLSIVIKISYEMINYDKEICFQGAIEKNMYEQYKDNELCYEIYGISNNCSIIICEELDTDFSISNLYDYGLDNLYNYIKNIYNEYNKDDEENELSEYEFYYWLDDYIADYVEDNYFNPFDDIGLSNIGISKKTGELKILDLGYGDVNDFAADVLEDLLINNDNNIKIRGVLDFNNYAVRELVKSQGGRENEIMA